MQNAETLRLAISEIFCWILIVFIFTHKWSAMWCLSKYRNLTSSRAALLVKMKFITKRWSWNWLSAVLPCSLINTWVCHAACADSHACFSHFWVPQLYKDILLHKYWHYGTLCLCTVMHSMKCMKQKHHYVKKKKSKKHQRLLLNVKQLSRHLFDHLYQIRLLKVWRNTKQKYCLNCLQCFHPLPAWLENLMA